MNNTFQPVLEAHDLNPWDNVGHEELGCRGDQPEGIVAFGWRKPNMHGPIATGVARCTPHLILQKFFKVRNIAIHHEVRQITGILIQSLQQLQTTKCDIPVVSGCVNKELWVGTAVVILQEIWERFVENTDILGVFAGDQKDRVEVPEGRRDGACIDT